MAVGETTGLVRIQVDDLLGRYSYRIPREGVIPASDSQLVILYGDNGSGKTTLLKLIFHLLSPSDERGHPSELLAGRYRRLAIELADGTIVEAERSAGESQVPAQMTLRISRLGQPVASIGYAMKQPESGSIGAPQQLTIRQSFATAIQAIGLDVYFLTDSRSLLSDVLPAEEEPSGLYSSWTTLGLATSAKRPFIQPGKEVSTAMARVSDWILQAAVGQSEKGELSASSLYEQVVSQIASAKPGRPSASLSREQLVQRLNGVARDVNEFARFGLMASFEPERLVQAVQMVPTNRLAMVRRIVLPFVEGLEARTGALRPIMELIGTFVGTLNSFFTDKLLRYTFGSGLQIVTTGTSTPILLEPDTLSSGERQLLLLFCNVLPARDRKSLFIIDEPELSLNVKWQRQLVSGLLRCTEGADIQFLLATHSIELLTQHQRNVQQLQPQ